MAPPIAANGRPAKDKFANRAFRFAGRVAGQPAFPTLEAFAALACALAIVSGAFRTSQLPLGERAVFWLVLIGWNWAKWRMWIAATVSRPADWPRAMILGTILLNLPIPLEIRVAFEAIGHRATRISPHMVWLQASGIALVIAAGIGWWRWRLRRSAGNDAPTGALPVEGSLANARVTASMLHAVLAEDHYCRLLLADGGERLVLCRFRDALAELAGLDGARVHRGAWVAASAITGARREARSWRLVLAHGKQVGVSATYRAEARRRGWLRRA